MAMRKSKTSLIILYFFVLANPNEARRMAKESSLNANHVIIGGVQVRVITSVKVISIYSKLMFWYFLKSASGVLATRNASGYVISARGTPVFMLEWLSVEYNFT